LSNFCFKFSIEGLVSFSRIILCIFTNCTTRYSGMSSFGVDEVLQSFVQCAPYFVSLSPMPRPYLVPLPPAYSICILHLHTPPAYSICTYHGSALSRCTVFLAGHWAVLREGDALPKMGVEKCRRLANRTVRAR